uniref:Uncharacterized protein n=1 Tax=Anopheles farauti TaxID=69004 RepID=A0A182QPQ1_9DIPT
MAALMVVAGVAAAGTAAAAAAVAVPGVAAVLVTAVVSSSTTTPRMMLMWTSLLRLRWTVLVFFLYRAFTLGLSGAAEAQQAAPLRMCVSERATRTSGTNDGSVHESETPARSAVSLAQPTQHQHITMRDHFYARWRFWAQISELLRLSIVSCLCRVQELALNTRTTFLEGTFCKR